MKKKAANDLWGTNLDQPLLELKLEPKGALIAHLGTISFKIIAMRSVCCCSPQVCE